MKINPQLLSEAKHARIIILISIILSWIGGFLSVYQAHEISKVINQVFLDGKTLESVIAILLTILIILVLRAVFVWGGELTINAAASKIKQDIRQRLFAHIQALGPAYLQGEAGESETQTGELVNLSTEGIDALEIYFSQYLPQVALAVLIPFTVLIFVFPVDALSGTILLITAPLLPIFLYLVGSAAEALTRKQWLGLSRMSAYFLDVLQGLTTLKALGRSKDQVEMIKKVSEQYRQTTMGVLRVTFLSALVLEMVATLGTAIVAVEIGIRLLYGKLAFEQAFFILLLAPEFYLPLRLLGTRFHSGMAGVEAGKRVYKILDLPIKQYSQPANTPGSSPSRGKNNPPHIVFKNVGYSYSNNRPALENVSIDFPAGKMTAIMGHSGAGKTTLTWLLLRFLQPKSGEIIVDGKSLPEFSLTEWRENLAWVPQNPYLFNDTIAANIKIAKPDADQSEIHKAAKMADAIEFIQSFPLGYETIIGERGAETQCRAGTTYRLSTCFSQGCPPSHPR